MNQKTLIPFDLKAALEGAPVVTRSGRQVSKVFHAPELREPYELLSIINGRVGLHYADGSFYKRAEPHYDLFMAPPPPPKTETRWLNLYTDNRTVHTSKDKADTLCSSDRIACIPVIFYPGQGLPGDPHAATTPAETDTEQP